MYVPSRTQKTEDLATEKHKTTKNTFVKTNGKTVIDTMFMNKTQYEKKKKTLNSL